MIDSGEEASVDAGLEKLVALIKKLSATKDRDLFLQCLKIIIEALKWKHERQDEIRAKYDTWSQLIHYAMRYIKLTKKNENDEKRQ